MECVFLNVLLKQVMWPLARQPCLVYATIKDMWGAPMNEMTRIRNLGGKAAVFGGTVALGGKIVALVEQELRFLSKDQWERLPPWLEQVRSGTGPRA